LFAEVRGPPRRSPLFPYTTLFRSADEEFREQVNELLRTIPEPRQRFGFFGPQRADPRAMSSFTRNVNDLLSRLTAAAQERLDGSDRKSTRLNSSHVKISYAVFCLK